MNSFSNNPAAFSMAQWGMPQITPTPQVQIPGMEFDPMGTGQPSPGFLPQGTSYDMNMPATPGATGGNWWDGAVGTKEAPGWGGMALGAAGGIMNAFMGLKQYGLARDTLETNKQQFAQNFGAQQKMTNSRLEDRQAARVASNPGAYQSVGDYMKKNGV